MDPSVVQQHEFKLKKLLIKFLEPGYRLGNDVYLNILLSHLSGKDNKAQAEELLKLPLFVEWLETAVQQWETTLTTPSSSIATFTLNLTSLISINELNFIKLNTNNIYMRLCRELQLRSKHIQPSVKLGYLKMLHSFMNHKAGLDWLVATDHWNDILAYCLENQTIYITREGYNFMFDLLSNFVIKNPTFCELITKKLIHSLEAEQFNKNGVVKTVVDNTQIQKDLLPTLKLVAFILEKCLLSCEKTDTENIPDIFITKYNLELTLKQLLMMARDPEFVFNISKPLYLINFISIDIEKMGSRETYLPIIREFARNFFDLFNALITKENSVNILKLCHLGHLYWKKLSIHVPQCEGKEPILFENQCIIFQILPILLIAFHSAPHKELQKDELTEIFIHKLFKISCEYTIRTAYAYRALLMTNNLMTTFEIGQQAIFYLNKTRQYFDRNRAVIVFQALMYALKNLTKAIANKTQMAIDLLTYQTGFLSAMLEGLALLIKDFKITWRESVETICLTSLTLDFLNCPNLPPKLAVQGLQLIHLTIANFMPPNLALLVDEISDSSITTITPMLYKQLHDNSWEIRDSALEILQTIVDIGHLKFPAFQKLVIDAQLCQLAVLLCTDDPESFVRASAIKSITAMVKVPVFWTNCLEFEQLPEKMMSILQNETEAIVRCEAAKFICEIYEHQFIPADLIMSVFTSMSSAVTHDLHWEVKVNGLHFWDKVIHNEMSDQGMIDGAFPTVTFSKENKKIVTLTEHEIQNRLNKVLLNLSECGCLGALITAMQDHCDLQVSRKSVEIINKLTEILKKYNSLNIAALDVNMELSRGVWDTFNNLSRTNSSQTTDSNLSESVIESIVNSSDMNLLGSVFQEKPKINHINGDFKHIIVIKPDEFKRFVIKDLDLMIDDRSRWLESHDDLNSLLDDILQSYEDNDVNSMDCY